MTPGIHARHAFLATVVVIGSAACATPQPVTDLATATARNTTMLQTQLSAFAAQQRTVADSRIANLVRLHQEVIEAEARRDRDLAIEREVGLTAPGELFEILRARARDSERQQAETRVAIAVVRTSLTEKQHAVEVRSTALQDTAKSLLAASESLSFKDHFELLFKFFSDVADSVKKAQADAATAKAKGDEKAGDAKKTVTTKP